MPSRNYKYKQPCVARLGCRHSMYVARISTDKSSSNAVIQVLFYLRVGYWDIQTTFTQVGIVMVDKILVLL